MIKRIIIFLVINFTALGLGGFFTGPGVTSEWYTTLNQAPWTPPGWVFGAAWTSIMICFSVYMAYLYKQFLQKRNYKSIYFSMVSECTLESCIFPFTKCELRIDNDF